MSGSTKSALELAEYRVAFAREVHDLYPDAIEHEGRWYSESLKPEDCDSFAARPIKAEYDLLYLDIGKRLPCNGFVFAGPWWGSGYVPDLQGPDSYTGPDGPRFEAFRKAVLQCALARPKP